MAKFSGHFSPQQGKEGGDMLEATVLKENKTFSALFITIPLLHQREGKLHKPTQEGTITKVAFSFFEDAEGFHMAKNTVLYDILFHLAASVSNLIPMPSVGKNQSSLL